MAWCVCVCCYYNFIQLTLVKSKVAKSTQVILYTNKNIYYDCILAIFSNTQYTIILNEIINNVLVIIVNKCMKYPKGFWLEYKLLFDIPIIRFLVKSNSLVIIYYISDLAAFSSICVNHKLNEGVTGTLCKPQPFADMWYYLLMNVSLHSNIKKNLTDTLFSLSNLTNIFTTFSNTPYCDTTYNSIEASR